MNLRLAFCAVTCLLIGSLASADDAAKKDLEKLQGNWVMQSSERDGKKLAEDRVKAFTRAIKGNDYKVTFETDEGAGELGGTFALDTSHDPKWIDAKMKDGAMAGKTMLGIFKLEGDRQTVCFAEAGRDRPKAFDSKQGTLTVWKRVKGGTGADKGNP
jgi:uncharacterized protein (TIGR03067 family)